MRSPEAPNTTRLHGSACLNARGAPLPVMPCPPCGLSLAGWPRCVHQNPAYGGEHFLGEGVLFARAETGTSLKTGLRNSVPAERRITPWTLSAQKDPSSEALRIRVITSVRE